MPWWPFYARARSCSGMTLDAFRRQLVATCPERSSRYAKSPVTKPATSMVAHCGLSRSRTVGCDPGGQFPGRIGRPARFRRLARRYRCRSQSSSLRTVSGICRQTNDRKGNVEIQEASLTSSTDPRPRVIRDGSVFLVEGRTCDTCGYRSLGNPPRCPSCRCTSVSPALFGPGGLVWAATTIRIASPGRTPPYRLAYVDIDEGPRVLVHLASDDESLPLPGSRVWLAGSTGDGDPLASTVYPR
jgi:uncharacterized protein